MSRPQATPEGYHSVTPYLIVDDARGLLRFIATVFHGEETECHTRKDGSILHAVIRIGDSPLMVGDSCPQMRAQPTRLYLYVADVDATYRRALAAGALSEAEPADMFWGDRFASVRDHWYNTWALATHIEDVSPEEIARRARQFEEEERQL